MESENLSQRKIYHIEGIHSCQAIFTNKYKMFYFNLHPISCGIQGSLTHILLGCPQYVFEDPEGFFHGFTLATQACGGFSC